MRRQASTNPRRSPRLAAKAKDEESKTTATTTTTTNDSTGGTGGTTGGTGGTTGADRQAQVAKDVDERLRKAEKAGGGGQKRTRNSGQSDGMTDDGSSSSSDSEVERRRIPSYLSDLWYCKAVHERVNEIPLPFNLVNAKVVKRPMLWVLWFEYSGITWEDIVSKFALDGQATRHFEESLIMCYSNPRTGEKPGGTADIRRLKTLWKMLALTYLQAPYGEGDSADAQQEPDAFFTIGHEALEEAKDILRRLDGDLLGRVYGSDTGHRYERMTRLDLGSFSNESAAKRAIRTMKRNDGDHQKSWDRPFRQRAKPKTCGKCEQVVNGPFWQHNLVCPKK